ncbi:MAG: hypothetical protein COA65_06910 [Rhodospirillaceae bacterium]|nr:MAG: hypothetical protein COA65_06910 [Rhodospirillaceae bacterium]
MIDSQRSRVVDVEGFMSGLGMDSETVQNEIQVIASRSLAHKVVDKLGLMRDAEFNSSLREPGLLQTWMTSILGTSDDGLDEEARFERERIGVVDALLDHLDVTREKRSRVLNIKFTTRTAKKAAKIVNVYADLYLFEQLEAKFEATRRGTAWLNERVADLRKTVEASEHVVEIFRKKTGLIRGTNTTVISQQISEINTQLILSRAQRAEAEARLQQVEVLVSLPGGVESAAEVLSSPLIQKLREQEAEVQRRAAELASEYGVRHPRMINVRAETQDLRAKIAGEVNKIVEGLRNEVGVSLAREKAISRNLKKLKIEASNTNSAEVRLRVLEREANANRALFDTFLSRLKETAGQEGIQKPDARIISRADIPIVPSFPKIKLIFIIALASSIFMGIGVAFVMERLDTGFRSSEQVESMTEVATLGLMPMLSGRNLSEGGPEDYVLERPSSSFAEALRTIHTGFLLSDVDNPPKTILVTSSLPGEGKSTIVTSLARMLARSGQKILVIDADLRRPRLHKALRFPIQPGLVEVLSGAVDADGAIRLDKKSGLHVLTAGKGAPNPPELLGSEHFRTLIGSLKERYDLVLIDSPPVLVVSDARVMANVADKTIFVIRWVNTRREVASMGIRQLTSGGAKLAGAVLSMVNVRKHARYGYGDSGYYYGASRKYYSD